MGHSGLIIGLHERKFIAQVYIQYHRYGAVQRSAAISRLTRAPLSPLTARTDCHWAWEKQPAKADHSNLVDFGCELD